VRDGRPALFACHQRDDGSEVPTRAVAGHDQPSRIGAELRGVLVDPLRRGVAVLGRGRATCLRRQPVLHAHHDGAGRVGQPARQPVVRLDGADHEPAAVEERDDRPRFRRVRRVDPYRNVTGGPGDHAVFDPGDLGRFVQRAHHRAHRTGVVDRHLPQRRPVARFELLDHRAGGGCERHGSRWNLFQPHRVKKSEEQP
jgi:hypothetical protein